MSRIRWVAGSVLLLGGISCAVVTATVLDGAKLQSQSVAAEGAILSAIGFALLAPPILRVAVAVLGPVLQAVGGEPARLCLMRIRQRTVQAATPMMPIVVCTAIAVGTFYLQAIWGSGHHVSTADDKSTQTLNYVVVGMIAVFAAVMLVNLLVADLTGRRRELAQLRLLGATPRQAVRVVGYETLLMLAVGLLLGTVAALVTVLPYGIAVRGTLLPDSSPVLYLSVVAAVVLLTVLASGAVVRRVSRTPAIDVGRGRAA